MQTEQVSIRPLGKDTTMRAAMQRSYGLDAIAIGEAPVPQPGAGEVVVRVGAATINPADWHLATGQPAFIRLVEGLRRPKRQIAGSDACGTIEALGAGVDAFQLGDRVFGPMRGAFAEFAVGSTDRLARAPHSMTDAEAAGLPIAGVTALQSIDAAEIADKRVVVNGASGGVGHYAIQLAKAAEAAHVAAVCSERNRDFVLALGADEMIDYATTDFADQPWDVVIDCVGNRTSEAMRRCITPGGAWISLGATNKTNLLGPIPWMIRTATRWAFDSRSFHSIMAKETSERLERLAAMVDADKLGTEVTQTFAIDDVRHAFDLIESQRARGKVAIAISS